MSCLFIVKKTCLIDRKGQIYETTFNIAKAKDGRNILYATKGNNKKIGHCQVSSITNNVSGSGTGNLSSRNIVSQTPPNVNSNSNNSTPKRVKDQSDIKKYGRNIADDLDRFATESGQGLYKVMSDTKIKKGVEAAWNLYEQGKIVAGYDSLKKIGLNLEKKAKIKGKDEGVLAKKFADTFDELYTRGRNNRVNQKGLVN